MGDIGAALAWVDGLLREEGVPSMVAGGLAARAHGATRPLHDIDLYVPGEALERIALLAAPHVVRPPAPHSGGGWDLTFMALEFAGRRIELAGAERVRILEAASGRWIPLGIDLERAVPRVVEGVEVRVMGCEELIASKRLLDRPEDRTDISQIEKALGRR